MSAPSKIDDIRRNLSIAITTVGDHVETEALAEALTLALQETEKLKARIAQAGKHEPYARI